MDTAEVKKWLLFPFGAAFGTRHGPKRGEHPSARPGGGDGGADAIPQRERVSDYARKDEEDAVEDFNAPIRWWIVSTLFPLIAGTFGPMASAFNICAIAIDWRVYVSSSSTEAEGTHVNDPRWLIAINAVSLAVALVANMFLLAHMSGRVRFNISVPCTIVGWYISGFIDIGLAAAAPAHLPLPPGTTWSQAYYYGCFAGALYITMSVLLTFTACGVWIFHLSSEFKLTMNQRSLMLQTVMYLGYLLAAAEVYSYIEGWNFLDAVYFVNVTLFTIGFGDFTPQTHLGRSLFFPMAVGGILFVGLIIANIRTLVLESGSRKISTRMVEKARFKALKSGDPKNALLKLRGMDTRQIDAANELERRQQEFQIMRDVLDKAAYDNRMITLIVSASSFFILWLIGAVVFWQAEKGLGGEDWSYFEALYFTYVALLTVGYGDFYPQTNSAKPSFVFWSLIALPTLTVLIGAIGDAIGDLASAVTEWVHKYAGRFLEGLKRLGDHQDQEKDDSFLVRGIHADDSFDSLAHAEALRLTSEHLPMTSDDARELQNRRAAEAAGYAYRPYIIMKEIQNVVEHLDADPPRKYTYSEWTWLLKLLDQDESDPEGHRRPGQPRHQERDVVVPVEIRGKQAWSWMGQESPLMSSENEANWILKRLLKKMERELRDRGDRHVLSELGEKALPRR
ncbi:hypothetical protein MBLNU459_g0381t1 [Dothideomycetes sp. NU459]